MKAISGNRKELGELETHRKEHGVKSLKVDAQADSQEAGHGKIDITSAEIKEHIRVSVYSAMETFVGLSSRRWIGVISTTKPILMS